MIVKAKKGLSFKVQGKRVTEDKTANVAITHDVKMKLREGSLIDIATYREPVKLTRSESVPAPKSELDKKTNKEK